MIIDLLIYTLCVAVLSIVLLLVIMLPEFKSEREDKGNTTGP